MPQDGEFSMEAGLGIAYKNNAHTIRCGKIQYMQQNAIEISSSLQSQEEILRKQGKALIFVAKDNQCIGIIALADTIRETAKDSIQALHELGIIQSFNW